MARVVLCRNCLCKTVGRDFVFRFGSVRVVGKVCTVCGARIPRCLNADGKRGDSVDIAK